MQLSKRNIVILSSIAIAAAGAIGVGVATSQNRSLQTPPVEISIADSFESRAADSQTQKIFDAANAFLSTLSAEQREAAIYEFADNTQRSNWSNFPDGPVQRGGVKRGDMSAEQLAALDTLLGELLSEDGVNNITYQLAAEDTLGTGGMNARFGSDYYYISFVGEPSLESPWMLQFGGHHLAINATIYGPDITFSPMLTGGQPLRIELNGQSIFTTETETTAAQAFLDSLTDEQKVDAMRGAQPLNLLLGPGEFGTAIAPEGVKASDLDASQKEKLLAIIDARLGFINADDYGAAMETIKAELDDAYFGWWGPEGTLGGAYFRITAPSMVLEYSPQGMGGDPTDHAHNMYRNPLNDYGVAWIAKD